MAKVARHILLLSALGAALAAPAGAATRIAYVHSARLVFTTPQGRELGATRRLGSFVTDIDSSPNGRHIALLEWVGTDGSHGDYYRAFVRTAGERRLREVAVGGPIGHAGPPRIAISPDGGLVALGLGEAIRVVDVRSGARWWVRRRADGFDAEPSFTADGRHLVFCHGTYPSPYRVDVYEAGLHGGHLRRLTHSRRDELYPELSADGSHLAFLRRARRGFDLFVARVGGGETPIGHVRTLDSRPDFSPGGRSIAYAYATSAEQASLPPWKIFTVRVDGSHRRLVLRGVRGGPLLPQWTRVP